MMPRKKAGGYVWNSDIAEARRWLAKQQRLIADHIDGKIDEDLLLTALLTLNVQADRQLETMQQKEYE